jgi:hypothetical protein
LCLEQTFRETTLVDNTLDPCDLSAWAPQPRSLGATRRLTPGSAACGSRRRATTVMRLPSVGAPAAAITTGSTSGTRTRDGFARRRIIGGHPCAGIGTPGPRAGGTECSAPQWRTSSTTAHPRRGARTSGGSFGPLRPSIGSASRNDHKISPACCRPTGVSALSCRMIVSARLSQTQNGCGYRASSDPLFSSESRVRTRSRAVERRQMGCALGTLAFGVGPWVRISFAPAVSPVRT